MLINDKAMTNRSSDLSLTIIEGGINTNDDGIFIINDVGNGNVVSCQVKEFQFAANNKKEN